MIPSDHNGLSLKWAIFTILPVCHFYFPVSQSCSSLIVGALPSSHPISLGLCYLLQTQIDLSWWPSYPSFLLPIFILFVGHKFHQTLLTSSQLVSKSGRQFSTFFLSFITFPLDFTPIVVAAFFFQEPLLPFKLHSLLFRSSCHELLRATMQLQLISFNNSDVNLPEEYLMGFSISKTCRALIFKTVAVIYSFTGSIAAMTSPHYHTFSPTMCM